MSPPHQSSSSHEIHPARAWALDRWPPKCPDDFIHTADAMECDNPYHFLSQNERAQVWKQWFDNDLQTRVARQLATNFGGNFRFGIINRRMRLDFPGLGVDVHLHLYKDCVKKIEASSEAMNIVFLKGISDPRLAPLEEVLGMMQYTSPGWFLSQRRFIPTRKWQREHEPMLKRLFAGPGGKDYRMAMMQLGGSPRREI